MTADADDGDGDPDAKRARLGLGAPPPGADGSGPPPALPGPRYARLDCLAHAALLEFLNTCLDGAFFSTLILALGWVRPHKIARRLPSFPPPTHTHHHAPPPASPPRPPASAVLARCSPADYIARLDGGGGGGLSALQVRRSRAAPLS